MRNRSRLAGLAFALALACTPAAAQTGWVATGLKQGIPYNQQGLLAWTGWVPGCIVSYYPITYPTGPSWYPDCRVGLPASTMGYANVLNYAGADPTGTTDSTAAFAAAAADSKRVYAPCGTYLMNWSLPTTGTFSVVGNGICTIFKPFAAGSAVITVSGGGANSFYNFQVVNRNAFAGDGLYVTNPSSSNQVIRDVWLNGFASGNGLNCSGSAGNAVTNMVVDNVIANNNSTGLSLSYCGSIRVTNSQINADSAQGIYITNSNNSLFANNNISGNGVGINATPVVYGIFTGNRIGSNNQQGMICNPCNYSTINNNQFSQNSNATPGAVESLKFTASSANNNVTGNSFYDTSGTAHATYGITLDATVSNIAITGNTFVTAQHVSGNVSGINSASYVTLNDNAPRATASTNWMMIGRIGLNTPVAGIGGAGVTTMYLSEASASTENGVVLGAAGTVNCFNVSTNAQPAVGETWTYTLRKNGVSQAMTATQANGSNAATPASCAINNSAQALSTDSWAVMVQSSNGATNLGAVGFRGSIVFMQ